MSEARFSTAASEQGAERHRADRMVRQEASALKAAVHGPMGRWLMMGALLLTGEGCANMRGALRDYRREVQTSYTVGRLPIPSASPESNVSADMLGTSEGRGRADRISPPIPESMRSTDAAGATMFGAQLSFRERSASGRRREARSGSPELLRSGDELFVRDEHGEVWLDSSHMEGRWWREMRPGTIYQGTDGRQYLLMAFENVRLPSAHEVPPPAPRRQPTPPEPSQPELTPVMHVEAAPSNVSPAELAHRVLHTEISYEEFERDQRRHPAAHQEAVRVQQQNQDARREQRQNLFRPEAQPTLPADPGIARLQQALEDQFGAEVDLQIYHRHEEAASATPPLRAGLAHELLGTAAPGHQEWHPATVYYLVRTREAQ